MTIKELYIYITNKLNRFSYVDRAIRELDDVIKQRPAFNPDKFKKWFDESNVVFRSSPLVFLTKCGIEDIKKGNFDNDTQKSISVASLVSQLHKHGISVNGEDIVIIEEIENYIIHHSLLTYDALNEWNKNALNYLKDKKVKTTRSFIALFKLSKTTGKLNVPYDYLAKKGKKTANEWQDLLDEIDGKETTKNGKN